MATATTRGFKGMHTDTKCPFLGHPKVGSLQYSEMETTKGSQQGKKRKHEDWQWTDSEHDKSGRYEESFF